jgi:hypothetical protein
MQLSNRVIVFLPTTGHVYLCRYVESMDNGETVRYPGHSNEAPNREINN